jgi:hypothetical protein
MAVGVVDTKIKFKLGARELTLDYRRVPFMKWSELKQTTTFTQKTLVSALFELDLDAIVALIWLERTQRERKLSYLDVHQELSNANGGDDEDFEVLDLIIKGKSVNGNDTSDLEIEGGVDPTGGS